jgi:hypothetical protein
METGSVRDQIDYQDMVHGLACHMRDDHATVLSRLSDLRADHPYLINIEHMFLGMSREKDDDPKFICYHNCSVGEDESGINVRRTLKAYSAYIRDEDDYIEDLYIIVAASMYRVNIAILECNKMLSSTLLMTMPPAKKCRPQHHQIRNAGSRTSIYLRRYLLVTTETPPLCSPTHWLSLKKPVRRDQQL